MDNFNYKKYLAEGGINKALREVEKAAVKHIERHSLKLLTVEGMLQSGAFSKEETDALRAFIAHRGNDIVLNEQTIKKVDQELLDEGLLDFIKDAPKKAAAALKSGWEGMKNAWGQFKDFAAGVAAKMKELFLKAFEWVKGKAQAAGAFIKDLPKGVAKLVSAGKITEEQKSKVPGEFKQLKESTDFIGAKVKGWISGEGWQDKVVSGDLKDVKENLITDKEIITILKEEKLPITEGGLHPEDAVKKYPALHKALKIIINGAMWIFNFPVKLVQTVIKMATKNVLKAVTWLSGKMGGPGPFEMAVLGTLLAEAAEVIEGAFHHPIGHAAEALSAGIGKLVGVSFAWAPGVSQALEIITSVVIKFGFFYAIATIVINVGKMIIDQVGKAAVKAADAAQKAGVDSGQGAGSGMGMREAFSPSLAEGKMTKSELKEYLKTEILRMNEASQEEIDKQKELNAELEKTKELTSTMESKVKKSEFKEYLKQEILREIAEAEGDEEEVDLEVDTETTDVEADAPEIEPTDSSSDELSGLSDELVDLAKKAKDAGAVELANQILNSAKFANKTKIKSAEKEAGLDTEA